VKVKYRKKFLKELSLIPSVQRIKIEQLVFKSLPEADSIHEIGSIEQMKGYPFCFKVRFGNYRIGLRMEDDVIVLEKALHRKDIYRHFP
jgi:mRNA interferase RelE/StbE